MTLSPAGIKSALHWLWIDDICKSCYNNYDYYDHHITMLCKISYIRELTVLLNKPQCSSKWTTVDYIFQWQMQWFYLLMFCRWQAAEHLQIWCKYIFSIFYMGPTLEGLKIIKCKLNYPILVNAEAQVPALCLVNSLYWFSALVFNRCMFA